MSSKVQNEEVGYMSFNSFEFQSTVFFTFSHEE